MTQSRTDFLDEQTKHLMNGIPAKAVLTSLRARYPNLNTFAGAVTNIRKRIFACNHRAPEYDPSPLEAVASNNPEIMTFLSASVKDQVTIQRSHRFHPTWSDEQEEALQALKIVPTNIEEFKLPKTHVTSLKRKSEQNLLTKNENLITVDGIAVLTQAINILTNAHVDDSYSKLILPLCVLSGRRFTEIAARGSFAPGSSITSCLFTGQLKTKSEEVRTYEIPLLCKFELFKRGIDVLRAKQGDVSHLSNDQIGNRYRANAQRDLEMGKFLPSIPTCATIHFLRTVYITLVYHVYVSPWSSGFTCCKCLGHASMEESLHYQNCRLVNVDSVKGGMGPLVINA